MASIHTSPENVPARRRSVRPTLSAVAVLGLALLGVVGPLTLAAPPAGASTTPAVTPAAAPVTAPTKSQTIAFTFPELGLADSYRFAGNGSSVGVHLPVPRALTPSTLTGTLVVPPDFGTGTVVVQSGTHYVGSLQLPANSVDQQRVPFFLNLGSAPIVGQYAAFTITIEQANAGQAVAARSTTCGGSSLPLELTDPAVFYTGSFISPTSIANFFPPVMDKLILYVPPSPTSAEEATALTVASAVVLEYHLVPTAVEVRSWGGDSLPPAPTGALDRAVVIRQTSGGSSTGSGTSAGLTLPKSATGDTLLVLSGSAASLPGQGSLLASQIAKVVQTQTATVLHSFAAPVLGESEQTFSQLGLAGTATFSGEQDLTFSLSEAQLGGVASALTVDLKAAYTPVEADAKATLSASVNGVVLGESQLTPAGKVTLPITIPGALVSRTTTLSLAITYFPAGFSCGSGGRTMTFTVDPRSTVVPTFATGGHGGFISLPQALFPDFQVAFDRASAARLTTAVQTVCGLQRESSVALHLEVVPLRTALHDHSPVLVVSSSPAVQRALDPPFKAQSSSKFTADGSLKGTVKAPTSVASLQVFDQTTQSRTVVLATTSGSWQLPTRLFNWLGNTSTKWASLTGDVLATAPKGTPADLAIRTGPAVFTPPAGSHITTIALGVAVVFALAVLLLVLWAVLRRRRNRRRESAAGGTE